MIHSTSETTSNSHGFFTTKVFVQAANKPCIKLKLCTGNQIASYQSIREKEFANDECPRFTLTHRFQRSSLLRKIYAKSKSKSKAPSLTTAQVGGVKTLLQHFSPGTRPHERSNYVSTSAENGPAMAGSVFTDHTNRN